MGHDARPARLEELYPSVCYLDTTSGKWAHKIGNCPTHLDVDLDCPIEEYCNDSQRLANMDSLFAIPYAFRYPEITKDQHTLNVHLGQKLFRNTRGFKIDSFVVEAWLTRTLSRSIYLPKDQFRPQLRHISLNGIYIAETFDKGRIGLDAILILVSGLLLVVVTRLWSGDWNVAVGAGSFFATCESVAIAIVCYLDSK
jgi:hypothetical protein